MNECQLCSRSFARKLDAYQIDDSPALELCRRCVGKVQTVVRFLNRSGILARYDPLSMARVEAETGYRGNALILAASAAAGEGRDKGETIRGGSGIAGGGFSLRDK